MRRETAAARVCCGRLVILAEHMMLAMKREVGSLSLLARTYGSVGDLLDHDACRRLAFVGTIRVRLSCAVLPML